MIQYMTIPEAAVLWKTSSTAIRVSCVEHQIGGAVRFGRSWLIPESAQKPELPICRDAKPAVKRAWDKKFQYVG